MKYKHLLASFGIAVPIFSAYSLSEGNYLHVRTEAGWKVLDIDKVERLTFKGGTMTATDKDNNVIETIPQESLQKMSFSESSDIDMSGISGIKDVETNATFLFDSASRTVELLSDSKLEVYSVSGKLLVSIPEAVKGESIDLADLSAGVVIIKAGNYSLKTILK